MDDDAKEVTKFLDCAYALRRKVMKKMEDAVDKGDYTAAEDWGRLLSYIST